VAVMMLFALKNWVKIQYDYESIFCIVDLHAITVFQPPDELWSKIEETAALFQRLRFRCSPGQARAGRSRPHWNV
jgi:hypothetical protein